MATSLDHMPRYIDRPHKTAIPILGTVALLLLLIVASIGVYLSQPH